MIKRQDGAYIEYETLYKMYQLEKVKAEKLQLENDELRTKLNESND